MVMIDELISCDEKVTVTSFRISEDCLFTSQGLLTETGLLENIAQTAAARTGWLAKMRAAGGEMKIPVGVIGAVKDFKLNFMPEGGSLLTTQLTTTNEIFNALIAHGIIRLGERVVAECEMKIFLLN